MNEEEINKKNKWSNLSEGDFIYMIQYENYFHFIERVDLFSIDEIRQFEDGGCTLLFYDQEEGDGKLYLSFDDEEKESMTFKNPFHKDGKFYFANFQQMILHLNEYHRKQIKDRIDNFNFMFKKAWNLNKKEEKDGNGK